MENKKIEDILTAIAEGVDKLNSEVPDQKKKYENRWVMYHTILAVELLFVVILLMGILVAI